MKKQKQEKIIDVIIAFGALLFFFHCIKRQENAGVIILVCIVVHLISDRRVK